MTGAVTIKLTKDQISVINEFVDVGIDNREEHLTNWARGEGYTEEDIQSSRAEIEQVKGVMASISAALDKATVGNKPSYDDLSCTKINPKWITEESIEQSWVIYSANESATMDGRGFWSLEMLWTHEEDATHFPAVRVGRYSFPMSLGQDRCWLNLDLARVSSDEDLYAALAVFCKSQNLSGSTPEEILAQDGLEPFQAIWLSQFIKQKARGN